MKSAKFRACYALSLLLTTLILVACNGIRMPETVAGFPLPGFPGSGPRLEQGPFAVEKSPNDNREYRALVLRNGMRVLLISDPAADKAAASVDVNAGSNSDPANFPGLAHFLEHMLFL